MQGFGWVALAGLLVACVDSQGGEDELLPATEQFCSDLCDLVVLCEPVSTAGCVEQCRIERDGFSQLSDEFAASYGACIGSLDCTGLYSQEAWDGCWDRAKNDAPATANTRRFCLDYATAWFECGYWYSTEDCEHDWAIWSDSVRASVLECTEHPCAYIDACIDGVL